MNSSPPLCHWKGYLSYWYELRLELVNEGQDYLSRTAEQWDKQLSNITTNENHMKGTGQLRLTTTGTARKNEHRSKMTPSKRKLKIPPNCARKWGTGCLNMSGVFCGSLKDPVASNYPNNYLPIYYKGWPASFFFIMLLTSIFCFATQ